MLMLRKHLSCSSCGRSVEFSPQEPPCKMLEGWLTVSHWKGLGSVEHYSFCSLTCLESWVEAQVPRIPKVFLESFGEE